MSLIDDLKEISIVDWLVARGYPISKETGSKTYFLSPLHQENNPSFVVFKSDNRWVDYGVSNRTGSIVDLIMAMDNCDVLEAMSILRNDEDTKTYEPVEISTEPLITVSKVLDKYIDVRLLMYLKQREIPEHIYSRFTKEVRYWFKDKPESVYSGVGFCNDLGGWEIRNSFAKLATSPKAITTLTNDGGTLNLFEGFINTMSALTYFNIERFEGTTIVLNGLGQIYRILDTLKQYQKINLFLDWGTGGNRTVDLIKSVVVSDKVFDHRYLWNEDEDFNDMLIRIKNKKQ